MADAAEDPDGPETPDPQTTPDRRPEVSHALALPVKPPPPDDPIHPPALGVFRGRATRSRTAAITAAARALPYVPPPALRSYDEDVWRHARAEEARIVGAPGYGAWDGKPDINLDMAMILIEWLCEVRMKFRVSAYSLHLAVALLHRFVAVQAVTRQKLQLLGCAALWMASKMEEEPASYPPDDRDMVYIADRSFTREQLYDMEMVLGTALDFHLHSPTAIHFLNRFVEVVAPPTCDTRRVLRLAEFCLEFCLFGRYTYNMLPSLQAAACLSIALHSTDHGVCTDELALVSRHEESAVAATITVIQARLQDVRRREGRGHKSICNLLRGFRGRFTVGLDDLKFPDPE